MVTIKILGEDLAHEQHWALSDVAFFCLFLFVCFWDLLGGVLDFYLFLFLFFLQVIGHVRNYCVSTTFYPEDFRFNIYVLWPFK